MAKYQPQSHTALCKVCNTYATVTIETTRGERKWDGYNTVYMPPTQNIIVNCACSVSPRIDYTFPKKEEPEVTKTFDTTASKSTALNAILNRVEDVERALYARVEARIRLETEHNAKIAEASAKLNRVLAESIHMGIEEEDLELYLPDHEEFLAERLIQVANEMSLANVLETV